MKVDVLNETGKKTGKKVDLPENVFAIEPHDHAIWLDIRSIQASRRQGTHSSKGRSYVSGGGKKPFRQKGTGRARQGTIRAPHHVGGGRVFGPHPHTYHIGINKKVKVLARKSALTYKAKENGIVVVEDFTYHKPKTSDFIKMLENLEMSDKKVLLLTGKNDKNIHLSASNLPSVEIRESVGFSTFDVLHADKLVVQESALQRINEVLGK